MSTQEIDILIKGIINGNNKCAEKLYITYVNYVITICRRYGIRQDNLKDCLQEIFLGCFSSLKRFDSNKGEFKYWLRKITINHILKAKRPNLVVDSEILDDDGILGIIPVIGDQLDFQDLLKLLRNMPEQHALIFNLYVIDGYSQKEISNMLSLNINTVKSHVKRGKDWAKKALISELQYLEN